MSLSGQCVRALTDFRLLLLQHLLIQKSSVEGLLGGDQLLLNVAILMLQLVNHSVAERLTHIITTMKYGSST